MTPSLFEVPAVTSGGDRHGDQPYRPTRAVQDTEGHPKRSEKLTVGGMELDPWMVKTLRRIADGQEHDRPPLSWVRARRMEQMGLLTIYQFRHRWMGGLTITPKGLDALGEMARAMREGK